MAILFVILSDKSRVDKRITANNPYDIHPDIPFGVCNAVNMIDMMMNTTIELPNDLGNSNLNVNSSHIGAMIETQINIASGAAEIILFIDS